MTKYLFLGYALGFALLFTAACTQETNIVGPDCHASANAKGGGGGAGSASGEGGAGSPGESGAEAGCSGASVAVK